MTDGVAIGRVCSVCDASFVGLTSAKYCSPSCRETGYSQNLAAYKARNRESILAKSREYDRRPDVLERASARQRKLYEKNRERFQSYAREWRAANVDKVKTTTLRHKYGITLDDYNVMLARQGGVCAACGGKGDKKGLQVDHCHDSGEVRGLLCGMCNRMVGCARDSADTLEGGARYLRAWRMAHVS